MAGIIPVQGGMCNGPGCCGWARCSARRSSRIGTERQFDQPLELGLPANDVAAVVGDVAALAVAPRGVRLRVAPPVLGVVLVVGVARIPAVPAAVSAELPAVPAAVSAKLPAVLTMLCPALPPGSLVPPLAAGVAVLLAPGDPSEQPTERALAGRGLAGETLRHGRSKRQGGNEGEESTPAAPRGDSLRQGVEAIGVHDESSS
jgi:hypothetical protein